MVGSNSPQLDAAEWSASRSGRFTWERDSAIRWVWC